jgi:peptidoglycan/xylan/chitin deacetylase (PgdA/CDA1 family)
MLDEKRAVADVALHMLVQFLRRSGGVHTDVRPVKRPLIAVALLAPLLGHAVMQPREVHQVLDLPTESKTVALTLDACGGAFDADLIRFLALYRIPATVFLTARWIAHNPTGVAMLRANPDLFQLENHGAQHVPAVIGARRQVYGIEGSPDLDHLQREIEGGAQAVEKLTGVAPKWYRGATAEYDAQALARIAELGYKVAGFSVNADEGASLSKELILARLKAVKSGDIIIAHMNRPGSDTAEGLGEGLKRLLAEGYRFVKLDDAPVRPLAARR